MNILRRLLGGDRIDTRAVPSKPVEKSLVQQVWESPALFNRKMRRAAGLLSKYWRWDLNASEETRRVYTPRYIRRHYGTIARRPWDFDHPKTRRQRKQRARIMALVARHGL